MANRNDRRHRVAMGSTLAVLGALALAAAPRADGPERLLPEFGENRPGRWLNSQPLTVEDLAGRVVLVDVWTFGCANCVRSIPWIRDLRSRYRERGLAIVGVHAPEFDYEKDVGRVREFVAEQEMDFPILIDNEMRYWKRLGNRYWPAVYLVDRQGRIRLVHIGETHAGTQRAAEVEQRIEALLAEGS